MRSFWDIVDIDYSGVGGGKIRPRGREGVRMSDHVKCTYCGNIVDACHVCGEDSPLKAQLAEAQAENEKLRQENALRMSEILEPLAFNCAYPESPCSYAHECRQIRHCKYIRTDITRETADAVATLSSSNAPHQARAVASRPECGCSKIGGAP